MSTDAVPKCQHCGELFHKGQCPRIKRVEYDGAFNRVKAIEYHDLTESERIKTLRGALRIARSKLKAAKLGKMTPSDYDFTITLVENAIENSGGVL